MRVATRSDPLFKLLRTSSTASLISFGAFFGLISALISKAFSIIDFNWSMRVFILVKTVFYIKV